MTIGAADFSAEGPRQAASLPRQTSRSPDGSPRDLRQDATNQPGRLSGREGERNQEVSGSYPRAAGRLNRKGDQVVASAAGDVAPGEAGGLEGVAPVWLSAPVLLRGPDEIPIPEFLRDRPGYFKLTLRCEIAADASSRVSVMDSSGVVALDEAVRDSFTGLRWYPGERNGVPVALSVRLIVQGSWQEGERAIDWGGRVPQPHL